MSDTAVFQKETIAAAPSSARSPSKPQPQRLDGIDTFRFLAILAVVFSHTYAYKHNHSAVTAFLEQLSQFSVPFFLITSGYFFGKSLERGTDAGRRLGRTAGRLLFMFFFWSVAYVVVPNLVRDVSGQGLLPALAHRGFLLREWVSLHPLRFFFEGTAPHLWFVMSLILSLGVLTAAIKTKTENVLLPASGLLYLCGLLMVTYRTTPIGLPPVIDHISALRESPVFSLVFPVIGYQLSKQEKYPAWLGTGLLALGVFLLVAEVGLLQYAYHFTKSTRYYLSTVPLGLGAFFLALAHPHWGSGTIVPSFGRMTIGVYLVHRMFVGGLLRFQGNVHPLVWDLGLDLTVYALSLAVVLLLRRKSWTARTVT